MPVIRVALSLILSGFRLSASQPSSFHPTDLRCEYLRDPLGIDTPQPRLSWVLVAENPAARGLIQSAYQILVATSRTKLDADRGDLWDSGKVASDQQIHVRYSGRPLVSEQDCFWKLRSWDQADQVSAWSNPARWSMGLLSQSEWQAHWIGLDSAPPEATNEYRRLSARWLRREFQVEKPVRRAIAYLSGLGLSELYLNGGKVGSDLLSPALSDYAKRVFYVTHDLTSQLKPGANAIGVLLGNGRFFAPRVNVPTPTRTFGFPKLLCQMRLDYADGTISILVSDDSWKLTANGPIRANNEYDGEEYDARLELPGWSAPGFDDSNWLSAQLVSAPGGILSAQMIEPIRVTQTLIPVGLTQPQPAVYIFDLGQNIVGWCRLKASGPRGTQITLRYAETLKPDGSLYLENLRSAKATDTYTLSGAGSELYEPHFAYHGFRYVELSGYPAKPDLATIAGRVVHDDLQSAGHFSCSDPMLNRIYSNILWSVRGNYRSVPTDCPQRDERQGWLGDRSAEAKGETYLFNNAALYAKWLQDMADAQKQNGSVPDVCPAYWPFYSDNVTWPSSTVIIPEALLEQYGDTAIIQTHYATMKKWVDYMSGLLVTGIIARDSYGDWCVPPEDPKLNRSNDPKRQTHRALLATAYLYHDLQLLAQYSTRLGQPADGRRFDELAAKVKTSFNRRFLDTNAAQYDNGSQTSYVLPLAFGLTPDDQPNRFFTNLVTSITHDCHNHLAVGLIGNQWLMRVLSDHGRPDLALTLATQRTYPSWGYMAGRGATTLWELWNGDTADPAMNSGNHVMLVGDLVIWLHENLAGIQADPAQPGFKLIRMRPEAMDPLSFVKASHLSPYGRIVSEWTKNAAAFRWNVSIPVNTTATLHVPAQSVESVTEAGQSAVRAPGVKFLELENGRAIFSVGSGDYTFSVAN